MTIDECKTLLASMISNPDYASSIADNIISKLQSDEEKRNKEAEYKKTETEEHFASFHESTGG